MKLPEKAVREFQEIYFKEFGEKLSYSEAEKMGQDLIGLFEIIMKPIPPSKEEPNSNVV